jgi:hypothetical protein
MTPLGYKRGSLIRLHDRTGERASSSSRRE